jgi:hypothetical protein
MHNRAGAGSTPACLGSMVINKSMSFPRVMQGTGMLWRCLWCFAEPCRLLTFDMSASSSRGSRAGPGCVPRGACGVSRCSVPAAVTWRVLLHNTEGIYTQGRVRGASMCGCTPALSAAEG